MPDERGREVQADGMKTLIPVFFLLACCSGGAEAVLGRQHAQDLQELIGSKKNIAIISNAKKAQACSVKPRASKLATLNPPDVVRDADRGPFVQLSPAEITSLQKLLLDDRSYNWGFESFCLPNYTIRVEFEVDGKTMAANLCFGCGQVLFSKDKEFLGDRDLTKQATMELFLLFRRAFPDDPILAKIAQQLTEHKS